MKDGDSIIVDSGIAKVFLTVDAVDLKSGLTNSSMFETYVKVSTVQNVDIFITTGGVDKRVVEEIEKTGVKVIIV